MRIALISLTDEKKARLGLVHIATYLKHRGGYDDIRIFEYFKDDIISCITRFNPDIIGISAMTIEYMRARRLARLLKNMDIECPIVIAGVHISTLPSSFTPEFDIGVIGEGEHTFLELVQNQEKLKPTGYLGKIRGILYWKKGKVVQTPPRPVADLSELPVADYSFLSAVHMKKKRLFWGGWGREMNIHTTRGCPYKCVFCSTSIFWRTYRSRPVDSVVEEITSLNDHGFDNISICDDCFVIDANRMMAIRQGLKKEGLLDGLVFTTQSRANLTNNKRLKILKSLNVIYLGYGLESGSDSYLKYLKANTVTLVDNRRAVSLSKKHGFFVQGSLIFGGPYETIKDMQDTIRFIRFCRRQKIDFMWSFVMTPLPGTQMWDVALARNKVSDNMDFDVLSYQNMSKPLMLDPQIPVEDFKEVFIRGRKQMNFVKMNIIKRNILKNPFSSIADGLSKPLHYMKMMASTTTDYGNPLRQEIGNQFNKF
jgi:anaerobic magnesium-protoporphyrin IX monomethyl ester cyclase